MKTLITFITLTASIFAMDNGTYACIPYAFADSSWKITKKVSKDIQTHNGTMLILMGKYVYSANETYVRTSHSDKVSMYTYKDIKLLISNKHDNVNIVGVNSAEGNLLYVCKQRKD